MIQQQSFSLKASELRMSSLVERADANKQRGLSMAAERRGELVADGQIEFLRALLRSPDGTDNLDDATDELATKFERGGKWQGLVPSGLARNRITEPAAVVTVNRLGRRRGFVFAWQISAAIKRRRGIESIHSGS
jgi:hypothetical protein